MGEGADEAAVLAAIVERDRADSSRAVSPLTCAPDAVRIDSSELAVDEVVRAVRDLVAQARRNQR
jgi:cytidylate kinase